MEGSKRVRELFKEYGAAVDASLRDVLRVRPELAMYGHMAYFMGFLDEALNENEEYGGKRFRSGLVLMLADWYGAHKAGVPVATSIELFHNFTLMHDDIVDGDTHRRGRKTVWNVWGVPHAINSGDGQALLAYKVLAEAYKDGVLTDPEVQTFLFEQYQRVIEGQYLDFVLTEEKLGDPSVTEAAYLDMVTRKTADLIAAATRGAALAAGAPGKEAAALFEYGRRLGVAYQICDDVVSIWGAEEATGKRAYGDILERKKTLPILYAREQLPAAGKQELTELYNGTEEMSRANAERVIELLETTDTYEEMRTRIDAHATEAKRIPASLSITDAQKDTLVSIVNELLPDIKNL